MKKILFLMMAVLIVGCSKDENPQEDEGNTDVVLSKTEVSLTINDEVKIEVSGVDIDECDVYSEDEFIAYATKYNGKIDIEAEHAGETNIIVKYKNIEKTCTIKVIPINDFVGPTVTQFGITENELKLKVEKPYESFTNNSQTKTIDVTYIRSQYRIINSYYFNNNGLCGVKKKIIATGSDAETFLNIANSMREITKYLSTSSNTISSYPKAHVNTYIFSYPNTYYAVYEQTKYDILYETGKSPATTNYVYFAKDLETAQKHNFIN